MLYVFLQDKKKNIYIYSTVRTLKSMSRHYNYYVRVLGQMVISTVY